MIDPEAIKPDSLPSVSLSCRSSLPEVPCIYFVMISQGIIQYIGRTNNLRRRWQQHHRLGQLEKYQQVKIAWLLVNDGSLLPEIEKALIKRFKPYLNQSVVEGKETIGPKRGRPGGNPALKDYQFSTSREEALTEKITIRISPSMLKQLKELDNYREFCRLAIAEKIQQDCSATSTFLV